MNKRLLGEIQKMDENNQYYNTMTKPLPAWCTIKRSKKKPTIREFSLIIESVSDEDTIGHLLILDIHFDENKATEKNLLFNEIYTPIFEKKKVLSPTESSVF